MSIGLSLFLMVLLLLGNAFFVGAEFAVISARRDRLEILAEEGKVRARMAIRACTGEAAAATRSARPSSKHRRGVGWLGG